MRSAKLQKPQVLLLLLPSLVLLGIALPVVFLNIQTGVSLAADAIDFHIPQINQFLRAPLDLISYPALVPMIPGYHVMMAWLAGFLGMSFVGNEDIALRLINTAISLCAVVLAVNVFLRVQAENVAEIAILALPFATSFALVQSAIYFNTDGASYLFLISALWFAESPSQRRVALGLGLSLAAMVLMRHLLTPVIALPALLNHRLSAPLRSLLTTRNMTFALIAIAPAATVIAIYVVNWGGLTPSAFKGLNPSGVFPHSWLHALAFLGILAIFFAPLEYSDLLKRRIDRRLVGLLAFSFFCALALWVIAPSSFDSDKGRWGSIVWMVAERTPSLVDRSPAVLAMAVVGGFFAAYLFRRAQERDNLPPELITALLYYFGLGLTQPAYQRYVEPLSLLCLAIFFHRIGESRRPWWTYLPLCLYTTANIAIAVGRLYL